MRGLFYLLISFSFFANAQISNPPIFSKYVRNFRTEDYGREYNAQNWSITQDKDGILYFGNGFNILTFDGMYWDAIPVTNNSNYITSLKTSQNNKIYWGGSGDFGCVETNEIGKSICVSFVDKLSDLDRYFSTVWRTLEFKDNIAFFTEESIFIYNEKTDSISVIYPEESFHLAFVAKDELYVRDRSYGLKKFNGDIFEKVPGGDVFKNYGIFGMYALNKSQILVVTQELGLFIYDITKEINAIGSLETANNTILSSQQIIGGCELKDGNIALNTSSNGVLIIDKKGEILSRINLSSGISDNDVKQVFQDNYGNLWMATNNGISSVNYSSPISLYLNGEKTGLQGSVKVLIKYKESLYVGTTTGLYVFKEGDNKPFVKIEGFSKNITTLCVAEDDLIIGTNEAIYSYNNTKIRKILDTDASALLWSDKTKHLYSIGTIGLSILKKTVNWKLLATDKTIRISPISLKLIPSSDDLDHIWVGTISDGLWNLLIGSNNQPFVETFGPDDGIGKEWVKPFFYSNKLYAGTDDGLLQYITKEQAAAEISDSLNIESKAYFFSSDLSYLDSGTVSFIEYSNPKYWVVYNGVVGQYFNNKLYQTAFRSIDIGKINSILPISDKEIWIGSDDGLAYVRLDESKDYLQKPDVRIRRFIIQNDSICFYNIKNSSNYQLDYAMNTFTIRFSSLFNENGKEPLFSYILEGFDDNWSPWSKEPYANYKKLREGVYSFKVKSRNIYGVESNVAEFSLTIPAPWFRTIWAFSIYIIALIFIIYLIFLWRLRKLKKRQRELERIVEERTREVVQQKQEIEKTHEEITDSINYAKRLQDAILPSSEEIQKKLPNHFILFKPKDVVSGDFYWYETLNDYAFIAAADSTGHGVPGAMVSVVCSNALNRAVNEYKISEPSKILDKTRELVIETFTKHGGEVKDGMDIALFAINNKQVIFSGANNPLWIVRKTEFITDEQKSDRKTFLGDLYSLIEIKANKQPIGLYQEMKMFKQEEIEILEGDTLYVFSDGFADQFGGPKGKKFKYKPFKKLLVENVSKSLNEQKEILNNEFEAWKGDQEQIDDVVVIGVKF